MTLLYRILFPTGRRGTEGQAADLHRNTVRNIYMEMAS